ncbi:MAG: competence damage-inducible protein A [Candidatus Bathyarchaeota archaeon]|nr:MAG: competence damage-inducible protein A [Candidatus Bathyarchaeota archaeon]
MVENVELISIGNELLIGKTLNTNAQWLSKRITSLGLTISRITVIGDIIEEIAQTLLDAFQRNPLFIITTGGLGPTFDDKTLKGVAAAFDSKLRMNQIALNMIRKKYVEYAVVMSQKPFKLTPARRKMAEIPEEAKPLPNPVGTAPAIEIKRGDITIFSLPGVPLEMRAIFEASLLPVLKKAATNLTFFETSLFVNGIMESEMAPLIEQIMHDNPYVYIKSHPMGAEKKPRIELHLSTTAEVIEIAKKGVRRALAQLSELIKAKGGKIKQPKKPDKA